MTLMTFTHRTGRLHAVTTIGAVGGTRRRMTGYRYEGATL
jgi:hypothetical protein